MCQGEYVRTSRIIRHFGSEFGFNIACLATPKLINTTSKSTTKYIMFLTIFPIMVTRGPIKYKLLCIYKNNTKHYIRDAFTTQTHIYTVD